MQFPKPGLALLTDLYQLTMAYGYWKSGTHEKEAVFNLFFRRHPFKGGFTIACGLHDAIEFLKQFHFDPSDLEYLAQIKGSDGQPLFEEEFLRFLSGLQFECDLDAIPEGTVVFPHEALLRVQGPILQCQLVETALLNIINYQSLIATKAARICLAARGDPVIEFGLRRAQGLDGALSASRAAYVGGCVATSNVLAGQIHGIPVKGTHAHSWVMAFDSELDAFHAYAQAMPNNCILLVDTYDSLEGVRHAVEIGCGLRERGHELTGIRLDSGDLAYLSIEARKILDEAGFKQAIIVASNDLDEHIIASLKEQDAAINVWGVGTRLVTAFDEPALGGVYKLAAIRGSDGQWEPKSKVSDEAAKATTPGIQQIRRFKQDGRFIGDAIYDVDLGIGKGCVIVDPTEQVRRKQITSGTEFEDLLVPVCRGGHVVYSPPLIGQTRGRVQEQLACLHSGIKRFLNPHRYPAGLELRLHDVKMKLLRLARRPS